MIPSILLRGLWHHTFKGRTFTTYVMLLQCITAICFAVFGVAVVCFWLLDVPLELKD